MPAAKPSKAAVANILKAVTAHGLHATAITLTSDGTMRVEIREDAAAESPTLATTAGPKKWRSRS